MRGCRIVLVTPSLLQSDMVTVAMAPVKRQYTQGRVNLRGIYHEIEMFLLNLNFFLKDSSEQALRSPMILFIKYYF